MSSARTIPSCHPDIKHYAKGMCHTCYERERYRTNPKVREKHKESARRWWSANRDKGIERKRCYRQRIYAEKLEAYGGCCGVCGSTEKLQLHHNMGNGEEHREQTGKDMGTFLHLRSLGWPTTGEFGCRLLCEGCHRKHHTKEAA